MDDSTRLFRHIIKEVQAHNAYHENCSERLDFTQVPKDCLNNINLLKSSLPLLYSVWLDKEPRVKKSVDLCTNLLRIVLNRDHKCPYAATFAIGKNTAHHPLQSFSRILADPSLKDAQHDVVEIMARMIDILAEASTSALDVVFSDIVTILITELDARRQCNLDNTLRTITCFEGLNLTSPTTSTTTSNTNTNANTNS